MRLHEVLEVCLDHIAIEGVLGCDPASLQKHLSKRDASIDEFFFAYIWTLLTQHPCIQLILTTHPLQDTNGDVHLGTAPLTADHGVDGENQTEVNIPALEREGIKGRQLAYHLAGEAFRTDKEAVLEKRVIQDKRRQEKRLAWRKRDVVDENGAGPSGMTPFEDDDLVKLEEGTDGLYRSIGKDDGDVEGRMVLAKDLRGLTEKWGSRLRIRCTDDEIYFRLVGTHQRSGKVTSTIFHILQLAARSREKGITAIELGPMVGSSQGSMHHYMKVLISLGLCTKVPAVLHSAITNLLVSDRFLEDNVHYRALTIDKLRPIQVPLVERDDGDDPNAEDQDSAGNMGFHFSPMKEDDLMAGLVVKERLIQLLDHPMLKNHLLKARNILPLLGWPGESRLRHRRAVPRHIDSLVLNGVVERLDVGEKQTRCLRLTKYNPDFEGTSTALTAGSDAAVDDDGDDPAEQVLLDDVPYQLAGGVPMTTVIEFQMNQMVAKAGPVGITLAAVREQVNGYFKRAIEFNVLRNDSTYVPPHLRELAICSVMESHGRERRLRAYGVEGFQQMMQAQGQTAEVLNPPAPAQAGRWADIGFRKYHTTTEKYDRYLDSHHLGVQDGVIPSNGQRGAVKGARALLGEGFPEIMRVLDGERESDTDSTETSIKPRKRKKIQRHSGYKDSVQERGRPRKYIHVVDVDGSINRRVIGSVYSSDKLPPVLIYLEKQDRLVEAPSRWNGRGVPPALSAAEIKKGKRPSWYWQFPAKEKAAGATPTVAPKRKRKGPTRSTRKSKRAKKQTAPINDSEDEVEEGMTVEEDVGEDDGGEQDGALIDGSGDTGPGPSTMAWMGTGDVEEPSEDVIAALTMLAESGNAEFDEPSNQEGGGKRNASRKSAQRSIFTRSDGAGVGARSTRSANAPASAKRTGKVVVEIGGKSAGRKQSRKDAMRGDGAVAPAMGTSNGPTDNPSALSEFPAQASAGEAFPRPAEGSGVPFTHEAIEPDPSSTGPMAKSSGWRKRKAASDAVPPDPATGPDVRVTEPLGDQGAVSSAPPTAKRSVAFTSPIRDGGVSPGVVTPPRKKRGRPRKSAPVGPVPATPRSPPGQSLGETPIVDSHGKEPDLTAFELPKTYGRVMRKRQKVRTEEAQAEDKLYQAEEEELNKIGASDPTFAALTGQAASGIVPAAMEDAQVQEASHEEPLPAEPSQPANALQATVTVRPVSQNPRRRIVTQRRPDLGTIRRTNELCQALKEAGGVMTDARLWNGHAEWTARVVGTDTPFAPAIVTGMDRAVFRKTLPVMLKDGRVKETIVSIPMPTGRWIKTTVLYLPETSQADVQAYIKGLSAQTQQLVAVKRNVPKIPATQFSEIRLPAGRVSFKDPGDSEATNRRAALLKNANVVSYLYGWKSGRCVRIETLHRAIVRAFAENPRSRSLVSTSPRIITLLFLFEELTVSEWFSCIYSSWYDERLEHFITDPKTRDTRLRDVPKGVRPPGGFQGFGAKGKLNKALAMLGELTLITPIVPVSEHEATVLSDQDGFFRPIKTVSMAAHFLLHEFAPVYHFAKDPVEVLSALPVGTTEETDRYWAALKAASLQTGVAQLPDLAEGTSAFEGSLESIKTFRSVQRWRHELRLLPLQRTALDEAAKVEAPDYAKIAYEYAIPREIVDHEVSYRIDSAKRRAEQRKLEEREEAIKARERHERSERMLRQKIEERQAQIKQAWEGSIRDAAERIGVGFSTALVDFTSRQTLLTSTRTHPNADQLEDIVRLYERSRELGPRPVQNRIVPRKPLFVPRGKEPKPRRPDPKDPTRVPSRRRKVWTLEEDESLIDAEAILRSRARGKVNSSRAGRNAMVQIFPDVGVQTFLMRLKKVLAPPRKQAYFERLEDAWHLIWKQHRGTDALPDADPDSMTDFHLAAHVKFLRENVVKFNIRLAAASRQTVTAVKVADLPMDAKSLSGWTYGPTGVPGLVTFTEHPAQLGGEAGYNSLIAAPMSLEAPKPFAKGVGRIRGLVSAVLKSIIATPAEIYDQNAASRLLGSFTKSDTNGAIHSLIEDKVIHKQSASETARFFGFDKNWLRACEGSLPDDFLDETSSMGNKLAELGDPVEWPLIGTSGDVASLMNLVSNHEVDFEIDVNDFPTVKYDSGSYNTRGLNDDSFEYDFRVVRREAKTRNLDVPRPPTLSCRMPSAWQAESVETPMLYDTIDAVIDVVEAAGDAGCSKVELEERTGYPQADIAAALAELCDEEPSRVFWAGYDTARLVAMARWSAWSALTVPRELDERGKVILSSKPIRCQPRKWTDQYGEMLTREWDKTVQSVMSMLIARPGQTEAALRAKLAISLDRIETNEVLGHLIERGWARKEFMVGGEGRAMPPVEATDVSEEGGILWYPAERGLWG